VVRPRGPARRRATFAGWLWFDPARTGWPERSSTPLSVLLIACPCAGAGDADGDHGRHRQAPEAGILIRDAEAAGCCTARDTLVVDKTGTLTEGRPKLVTVEPED
jgi:Cu+-exporting ATPase